MVELKPTRYTSLMKYAEFQEELADKLGIPVAHLIPPANIWKARRIPKELSTTPTLKAGIDESIIMEPNSCYDSSGEGSVTLEVGEDPIK